MSQWLCSFPCLPLFFALCHSATTHATPLACLPPICSMRQGQALQDGISSASISAHEDERFALTCREMQMGWC